MVAILLFMPVFLAFVFWDVKGGVARMTSLNLIKEIQAAVTIPVMAKCRIISSLSNRTSPLPRRPG